MTGPEHYKAAETLLGNLRREMSGAPGALLHTPEQQARMIAEAQVHATLALTMATIAPRSITPGDQLGYRALYVDDEGWSE